ncbi:hypothetical protein NIES2107_37990 [Nostoc carneum NIES-2107]|nr:hypothetical protein NIES2107_37990 [Nostoc carneum NIES-2107]
MTRSLLKWVKGQKEEKGQGAGGKGEDWDGAWTFSRTSVLKRRGFYPCSASLRDATRSLLPRSGTLHTVLERACSPCSLLPSPLPLSVKVEWLFPSMTKEMELCAKDIPQGFMINRTSAIAHDEYFDVG